MAAPSLDVVAPGSAHAWANVPMLPQEVKFFDYPLNSRGFGWHYLATDALLNINQGYDASERIGRSIRVVGVVLRASVDSFTFQDLVRKPVPYTVDFVWNNMPGVLAPRIEEIYAPIEGQIPDLAPYYPALPNLSYSSKYAFIKRVSREPKHQISTLNVAFSCNKLINFETYDDGSTRQLTSSELLLTCASQPDVYNNEPQLEVLGLLRILYVDA